MSVPPLRGQQTDQWAVKMFTDIGTSRAHDFGSVALHAEVEHYFTFQNLYKETVEISSVSTNCGCTKASYTKKVIRSGEKADIIAKVDTSGKEHTGKRKVTITVRFSKPTYAEVQLQIKTYIRSDVGFEPGSVEFGTVAQGKGIQKKVYLQYEGRSDWSLTSIKKTNPGIRAEAKEVQRNGKHVTYEISVFLKDNADSGYLNDLLRFTTNDADPARASIFLPIHGLVMAPLTAKPSILQLGVLHPGDKQTKNLVICGTTPFRILNVTSNDPRISFRTASQTSTVQVIAVTCTADQTLGEFHPTIRIRTNHNENTLLQITGYGTIIKKEELPIARGDSSTGDNSTPSDSKVSPEKTGMAPTILKTD
ncbi:MAG: DUF1573 domain-containing protein [Thermoguttaceae bacterium]|nr:DUF1573 domain-containing protein [Thermoguttaceae bacterium]